MKGLERKAPSPSSQFQKQPTLESSPCEKCSAFRRLQLSKNKKSDVAKSRIQAIAMERTHEQPRALLL